MNKKYSEIFNEEDKSALADYLEIALKIAKRIDDGSRKTNKNDRAHTK